MKSEKKVLATPSPLSIEEKKKALAEEEAKEKSDRLSAFANEHKALLLKYNCRLVAQAIIEGERVSTRIVTVSN